MRLGSLFSGIGGLELGLEWTGGFETVWQVEVDPYCREVLARHWPEVKRYADIKQIQPEQLDTVDLVCGGFPCQPVSLAGRRLGQKDPRWLWPHFARVLRVVRPRYVLVENVPGLLHHGFGDVLGDLATLGYDAEWSVLAAADVGAPQERERVFVVAYASRLGCGTWRAKPEGQVGFAAPASVSTPADASDERSTQPGLGRTANGLSAFLDDIGWPARPGPDQFSYEPLRVAKGVADRVARIRALGDAVVPRVAYVVGLGILAFNAGETDSVFEWIEDRLAEWWEGRVAA